MLRLPFWPPVHLFLVRNKKTVAYALFTLYLLALLMIVVGFYLFQTDLKLYVLVAKQANRVGQVSLYLFLFTLIPGILKRLKILPLFSASIVLFRRHLGILIYSFALLHSMYLSAIPMLMTQGFNYKSLSTHEVYGSLAVLILFPVWLTSNDFSQKKLGKFWKTIQRLTYIAIIFIFLHVATVNQKAMAATIIIFVLESVSWIKVWFWDKRKSSGLDS